MWLPFPLLFSLRFGDDRAHGTFYCAVGIHPSPACTTHTYKTLHISPPETCHKLQYHGQRERKKFVFHFFTWLEMPTSLPANESPLSLIPPTPESDISNSPQSSPIKCDLSDNSPIDQHSAPATTQKRKAGRKPLYKTAQERRDRNRRAQLAFRARRSDYLARLEETCRSLENVVMELQQSNRAANDALTRERNKVRCLERVLQTSQLYTAQQEIPILFPPASSAIAIPADNNTVSTQVGGQHGTSNSQMFPQAHSLISLEQQFSPSSSSPSTGMNNGLFTENYLGMLPLPMIDLRVLVVSCRSVTGLQCPSYEYPQSKSTYDRTVRPRRVSTNPTLTREHEF